MTDSETTDEDHESFIRWQQATNNERGKTINLFIGMSFATVGFIITQLIKSDFKFRCYCDKILIVVGTLLLLLHIIILILLVLNRLKDFRLTTKVAKLRNKITKEEITLLRKQLKRIENCTHLLFDISLIIFVIAEPLIILGFIINVSDKF